MDASQVNCAAIDMRFSTLTGEIGHKSIMLNRRQFINWGCASCAIAFSPRSFAASESYLSPDRFARPQSSSEEGGLWALMDREERVVRRSPQLIRDEELNVYLRGIVSRLAGPHASDIRVYALRTPHSNASMAPNGMLQIWSGLLLRVHNEAQLAAILGHEIGHFFERHSLARMRDAKEKSAMATVFGLFGLIGAIGQLAVVSSAMGYVRDHERSADRIGAMLMNQAGYRVDEAAAVWSAMLEEMQIRENKEATRTPALFDSHPPSLERRENLLKLAQEFPGGETGEARYRAAVSRYLESWCEDEIRRSQYSESIALFTRIIPGAANVELIQTFRAEALRLRAETDDHDAALKDYRLALSSHQPIPRALRGIGLIERQRGHSLDAVSAFRKYLELQPDAPDAALIESYIKELGT
jgi:beta-barrel assembly-enhancing protease